MSIAVDRRLATQTRQNLYTINPETRPHNKTTNVFTTADICIMLDSRRTITVE
jgi:hypothetical protein